MIFVKTKTGGGVKFLKNFTTVVKILIDSLLVFTKSQVSWQKYTFVVRNCCQPRSFLAEIHFCVEKILSTKESASSGEDSASPSNSVEDGASNHHTKAAKVQVHLVVIMMMRMVVVIMVTTALSSFARL